MARRQTKCRRHHTRPERAFPFPKRVIVFSPHPDDDVISMGGTIRRLIQQENEVHVAYETSGDIAVDNEEVRRYLHSLKGFQTLFDGADQTIVDCCQKVLAELRERNDEEAESAQVLAVKSLIRQGEARLACCLQWHSAVIFISSELPFYESGKIEKLPSMTEATWNPSADCWPTLSHRNQVYGRRPGRPPRHPPQMHRCRAGRRRRRGESGALGGRLSIWMYRGAWAEWDVADIEMCVPMSSGGTPRKRNAILKHQSQMESAPFLGNDERLFWQRAEDRNRETAQAYDRLGLACYEAMEAFVEYRF